MTTEAVAIARPLPSATVVLVRDGEAGPEVLLVLRHAARTFGSSFVFPGGILDLGDQRMVERLQGVDDALVSRSLDLGAGGSAYYSAAIRELFEEAGVLLARDRDGHWVRPGHFEDDRAALNEGSLSWGRFVETHDLLLAGDALHYFSYWVTPREAPRRFSTRFFIALLPPGQVATHCGGELVDSRWMTAGQALAAHRRDEIELPYPTMYTLQEMRDLHNAHEFVSWAEERRSCGISCNLPSMTERDGELEILMPGDPNYPVHLLVDE
ncbi:MAG: NUDIX hydrolase [Gammaproteobacteria bacterium]|nr:NUDIX hydrolase [Gammaproteobacteria bacterium]MDH4256816.1 NUDIX hydrolase [Gammaproteobacteria bacterium]MDH5311600.1 NUDIX hydrolase [Gammaproteobacteria bacterium]